MKGLLPLFSMFLLTGLLWFELPEVSLDEIVTEYCETYEEDCTRDNDDDGIPDNGEDEDDGGYS